MDACTHRQSQCGYGSVSLGVNQAKKMRKLSFTRSSEYLPAKLKTMTLNAGGDLIALGKHNCGNHKEKLPPANLSYLKHCHKDLPLQFRIQLRRASFILRLSVRLSQSASFFPKGEKKTFTTSLNKISHNITHICTKIMVGEQKKKERKKQKKKRRRTDNCSYSPA